MPKRRANGEGSIYKRRDGTWAAQFIDFTGKKKYFYGRTQREVKEKLKNAIRQSDDGFEMDAGKITLTEWAVQWLETYAKPVIKAKTYFSYHVTIYQHIIPAFPNVLLKNIREDMLQKYLNKELEHRNDDKPGGYSRDTVLLSKLRLFSMLEKAVDLGMIPRNPAKHLSLPPISFNEKTILTKEQQKCLEQVMIEEVEYNYDIVMYFLMLYGGLRSGEASALKISDIDFERKELTIRRTLSRIPMQDNGSPILVGTPKTKKSNRTIPLPEFVIGLLRFAIKEREERINALADKWSEDEVHNPVWIEHEYLFLTMHGNVVDGSVVGRILHRLERKAEVEPYVTPHGLRHTFATRWIEAGFDVKSLADIMGHADVKMTLNIYTHSLPEQKRSSMNDLADILFNK